MLTRIYNWMSGKKSVYGSRIFQQRTWLEKTVQEAQYKQSKYQVYNIK